jgi:prolyl-tRNA synthetase
VPLRIEVGRREAEARAATVVDRLGRKHRVSLDSLETDVRRLLDEFDIALFEKAQAAFHSAFSVARSLDELAHSESVRVLSWCGSEECGHRIETAIDGALLGTPEEGLPIDPGAPGPCVACGASSDVRWALASQPI